MTVYSKIRGIIGSVLQLGIGGVNIQSNSGVFEVRNAANNAYAKMAILAGTADNEAVTKYQLDSAEKPTIIKRQANCSSALPVNTAVRGFVVVSTAGTGAVIGDLLFDDGSETGDMAIVAAVEGRVIAVTDALSGGTVTFEADSIYCWDSDGSAWLKIGDVGATTGAIREIRFVIDNSASQDSASSIPANARISSCSLEVTTSYSAGATITVGSTADGDAVMVAGDNNPQATSGSVFEVPQDTAWHTSASVVRVAISNTPAAGAGVVIVKYSTVNV